MKLNGTIPMTSERKKHYRQNKTVRNYRSLWAGGGKQVREYIHVENTLDKNEMGKQGSLTGTGGGGHYPQGIQKGSTDHSLRNLTSSKQYGL